MSGLRSREAATAADVAAQSLLPPAEHPFWARPDAATQALLATAAMEQERQSALAALEQATSRVQQLTQALARFEGDARSAREAAAREAAARASAESASKARAAEVATLKARLRELEAGAVSGTMASAAPGAAAVLAQRECVRLTEQLAAKSKELAAAEARLAAATPSARERERRAEAERVAAAAAAAAAAAPPRAPSPGSAAALAPLRAELAAARAEADAARADLEALRAELSVERNRCRGLSRALATAEAAAAKAANPGKADATASDGNTSGIIHTTATAPRGTSPSGVAPPGRDGELDALRVALLEERLRCSELAAALAARQAPATPPAAASASPQADGGSGMDAEMRKLRERCRQMQTALDAERSRALDYQARWEATQRVPSPITVQSRVNMHLHTSS